MGIKVRHGIANATAMGASGTVRLHQRATAWRG